MYAPRLDYSVQSGIDQVEEPNSTAGARRANAKKHLSKQTVVTFRIELLSLLKIDRWRFACLLNDCSLASLPAALCLRF